MKRKVLSLAMIAALCLTMLPTAGWAANDPVAYIDFDENGVQKIESREKYSLVTENNTEWNASDENNGWYVVSSDVTIGTEEAPQRVTVSGDVHLILANGADLTVNGGIGVNENNSLTIYAQPTKDGETPGSLTVENVQATNAGIGGGNYGAGGTITINGGTITTNGGVNSAGIGGGDYGSGGKITINGGAITATGGSNGAGIGGGANGSGDKLTINGGTVEATGNTSGAGIGGGSSGSGGDITIYGGTVDATGDDTGAGIGGGFGGPGGNITINGGDEITATGTNGGAGIGGGLGGSGGNITINGGDEITATGTNGGAGIGSGYAGSAGSTTTINISGGIVRATGGNAATGYSGGAGIGNGGVANSSAAITISGGTVTATGGEGADGIGRGEDNLSTQPATFSTGDAGNAVIYATAGESGEAIVGSSSPTDWDAIIFTPGEGDGAANSGKVYGDVKLVNDLTIKSDQSLTIPAETSLEIPEDVTLKIAEGGTLTIGGELVVYGELEGYNGNGVHRAVETEWLTDENDHWHACAIENCAEHQFDKAAHSFTDGKCSVCDYVQPVESLSLSETSLTMTVGDSKTLTATVEPDTATNKDVTWSSSDDSVATVADGAVTAVAAGSATITATSVDDPDIKATCAVTVKEASDPDPGTDPEEPGTDPEEPGTDPDPDEPGGDPSTEPDNPAEDDPSDKPSTPVIPSDPDPEIEVTEPAHGDVEISPSKPEAGGTVTITPKPDAGYEVEDVIVTDEDGERVPVTENPDGSWSYEQLKSDVTIEVVFGEIAPEPTVDVSEIFLDVDPDAWYKDAVQFAYDNGLMTGTSATEFAPDVTTTRAMIVSILARLEGVTSADDAGFSDVDDEWFATAVNWAASVGVVNGFEDNTFRPNDAITREQLAAILCNYAAWKGEDVLARAELSRSSDAAAISSWATDVMGWAVAENLISGVTTDELQPQGAATRAQVAAILQRFLSK